MLPRSPRLHWDANDFTSNGGFVLPNGSGQVIPTMVDTHLVCMQPHSTMGMKGIIVSKILVGFQCWRREPVAYQDISEQRRARAFDRRHQYRNRNSSIHGFWYAGAERLRTGESLTGAGPFAVKVPLTSYTPGVYFVELKSAKARLSKKFFTELEAGLRTRNQDEKIDFILSCFLFLDSWFCIFALPNWEEMAKKGNRVQVILECTEHKTSGMPGTSRYITTKEQEEYTWSYREEVQSDS